jgi:hypothetical protein
MNVVFGKAKFFLWKFLDCFEKCQMMQFLEWRISVLWLLLISASNDREWD